MEMESVQKSLKISLSWKYLLPHDCEFLSTSDLLYDTVALIREVIHA